MLCVCIPTYKRVALLQLLVQDLQQQTIKPDNLVVVDGDPQSGAVSELLRNLDYPISITYIPSNHGNLAYQRYLGWRAASGLGGDVLIYFDDDERLLQYDLINHLIQPLGQNNVVGVGCPIRIGEIVDGSDASKIRSMRRYHFLAKWFGHARITPDGGVTPVGHRKNPLEDQEQYVNIDWLRGGAMAYWMQAISPATFSDDLFALDHIRCGLGEDTFLSRRIGAKGKLLYTFRAVVDHPNADTPKSYPFEAYKYAYAATYSRRFQNDYYRVYDPPKLIDRWALLKSFVGNVMLAWGRAVAKPNKLNLSLARGTTLGAFHGLTRPPTAKYLTPEIDWWADAELALEKAETI